MWTRTVAFIAATALGWLVVANCGSERASCEGAENCNCYGNGTCDEGLACRSTVCVDLNSTGVGGSSNGGSLDVQACLACAENKCPTEAMACKAVSGCDDIIKCLVGCNKDATCLSRCNANASTDANMKSLGYQTCAFTSCVSECVYSGTSSGAGGATGSGGATGAGGAGGSSTVPTCATCEKALACCLAVAPSIGLQPKDCGYYNSATCSMQGSQQSKQEYANNCRDTLKAYAMDSTACQ